MVEADAGNPHGSPTLLWWGYELFMAALALLVVWLLTQPDEGWIRTANLAIWGAFVADYGVRFTIADDRRQFVKSNIPDLIAIMPLDFLRVARVARLARLVRLVRAGVVLWRIASNLRGILATNGLGWLLVITATLVVGGGAVAWAVDDTFPSFADGVWWSLVTTTTVGYGDIAPENGPGRAVAGVLMLVGIGTLGMITATLATYFVEGRDDETRNRQVDWVRQRLGEWDALDRTERRQLAAMLSALAEVPDSESAPKQPVEPTPASSEIGRGEPFA